MLGWQSVPGCPGYCATKYALEGTLRVEISTMLVPEYKAQETLNLTE